MSQPSGDRDSSRSYADSHADGLIASTPYTEGAPYGGPSRFKAFCRVLQKHATQLCWDPRSFFRKCRRVAALYREGGAEAVVAKVFPRTYAVRYQEWIERFDVLNELDRIQIRQHIESWRRKPKISVILPVYNPPVEYLELAIASVVAQIYTNWELCIADDASTNPEVKTLLNAYQSAEPRIKLAWRDQRGHISAATNTALGLASGDYIALLDQDDLLSEHALYLVANAVNDRPGVRLIYSDEDRLTESGERHAPHFKPDLSPELLLSQNYICHLQVVQRELVSRIGGFREGVEGAQDWDLALRALERLDSGEICHIPFVLYHWRTLPGSTAGSASAKAYVGAAQSRVVREHLERTGERGAAVGFDEAFVRVDVSFPIPEPEPLVSIIVPIRDRADVLRRFIESLHSKTVYRNTELIIVDNGSAELETAAYLEELSSRENLHVIRDDGGFNFSRLNNEAVRVARGSLLAFCNNDLEVISPGWLTEMVSLAVRPGVGAVGAKLYYPDGRIQHAGVLLGIGGVAGHGHKRMRRGEPGYQNRAQALGNFSAVTGACMVIRRGVFEEVGGFDEQDLEVAFNDVDLCIRLRAAGYRNVFTPHAELYHYESATRGSDFGDRERFLRFEKESAVMKKRWGSDLLSGDPYYNPNLSLEREDFSLSFVPRVERPWQQLLSDGVSDPARATEGPADPQCSDRIDS